MVSIILGGFNLFMAGLEFGISGPDGYLPWVNLFIGGVMLLVFTNR